MDTAEDIEVLPDILADNLGVLADILEVLADILAVQVDKLADTWPEGDMRVGQADNLGILVAEERLDIHLLSWIVK